MSEWGADRLAGSMANLQPNDAACPRDDYERPNNKGFNVSMLYS